MGAFILYWPTFSRRLLKGVRQSMESQEFIVVGVLLYFAVLGTGSVDCFHFSPLLLCTVGEY